MDNANIDIIDKLVNEILFDKTPDIHRIVYHYTRAENVNKILQPKDIHIRMTHYEDFEDKLEGKVVDVYLDLALERLLKERKINNDIYSILTIKDSPPKELFSFNQDSQDTYCKMLEYDTYVACFCTQNNYQYMYDNYAGFDGYCIGFSELGIKEIDRHTFGNGFRMEYTPIMYGEEVVEYFYHKILELVLLVKETSDKIIYIPHILKILRKRVQYSSKLYGYSNEKEVRLILKIPKEHSFKTNYPFTLKYDKEKKRRYLEFSLPKYCCWNVNSQNPTSDALEYLKKNNYRYNAFD